MIPSPWVGLILGLAAFRLLRLLSYDTFPPVARARAWILGEQVSTTGNQNARMGLTNEPLEVAYSYRWPVLADLVQCAFCLGLWVSAGVYVAWVYEPAGTLYAAAPLALSAFVGLVAKNWDP